MIFTLEECRCVWQLFVASRLRLFALFCELKGGGRWQGWGRACPTPGDGLPHPRDEHRTEAGCRLRVRRQLGWGKKRDEEKGFREGHDIGPNHDVPRASLSRHPFPINVILWLGLGHFEVSTQSSYCDAIVILITYTTWFDLQCMPTPVSDYFDGRNARCELITEARRGCNTHKIPEL